MDIHPIVIATGEKQKLQPLTAQLPGPLLPVVNRPVMTLAIESLARQGFKQIDVNLLEKGAQVERYLVDGARWGVSLKFNLQQDAWGDGGAVKWAIGGSQQTWLVLPGDAIVDFDVAAAWERHRSQGSLLTAILARQPGPADLPFTMGTAGRLAAGRTDAADLVLTGAFLLEPEILAALPLKRACSIGDDLLPALLAQGKPVTGYEMAGYFNSLETFAQYQAAQQVYLASAQGIAESGPEDRAERLRFPTVDSQLIVDSVWVGRHSVIHPAARLSPPVYIGENCQIGRAVELGPNAIVGDSVVIGPEATVNNCTILEHTYVGQLVDVSNRIVCQDVLIDTATGHHTRIVDQHLLSQANLQMAQIPLGRLRDLLAAVLLLTALLPLLLLTALVAMLSQGRLYDRQMVMGKRPHAAQATVFALYHFALPAGSRLRRLGWHRLAELRNLLTGDLTLVGVQPLARELAAKLTESWQQERFNCPAGLTGLWYLQAEPDSSADDLLIADIFYVVHRSWREDLRILWKTPGKWFNSLTVEPQHLPGPKAIGVSNEYH